jgi:hypothetical protein
LQVKNAFATILQTLADHFVLLMENKLMFAQTQDVRAVVEVNALGLEPTVMKLRVSSPNAQVDIPKLEL